LPLSTSQNLTDVSKLPLASLWPDGSNARQETERWLPKPLRSSPRWLDPKVQLRDTQRYRPRHLRSPASSQWEKTRRRGPARGVLSRCADTCPYRHPTAEPSCPVRATQISARRATTRFSDPALVPPQRAYELHARRQILPNLFVRPPLLFSLVHEESIRETIQPIPQNTPPAS
jgi:hypothetical protein